MFVLCKVRQGKGVGFPRGSKIAGLDCRHIVSPTIKMIRITPERRELGSRMIRAVAVLLFPGTAVPHVVRGERFSLRYFCCHRMAMTVIVTVTMTPDLVLPAVGTQAFCSSSSSCSCSV